MKLETFLIALVAFIIAFTVVALLAKKRRERKIQEELETHARERRDAWREARRLAEGSPTSGPNPGASHPRQHAIDTALGSVQERARRQRLAQEEDDRRRRRDDDWASDPMNPLNVTSPLNPLNPLNPSGIYADHSTPSAPDCSPRHDPSPSYSDHSPSYSSGSSDSYSSSSSSSDSGSSSCGGSGD